MFRDKNFLIEQGLDCHSRADVFYIIGYLYDDIKDTGIINRDKYNELKKYLESHRELLNNKDYSIVKYETIVKKINNMKLSKCNSNNSNQNKINNLQNTALLKPEEFHKIVYSFNKAVTKEAIHKHTTILDWSNKTGIYGIFEGDTLIYIGKTRDSFKERFKKHKDNIKKEENNSYLYKKIRIYLQLNKQINFFPLIILEDLQMENKRIITDNELNCMELALIISHQPECNIEGRIKPYVFRKN